MRPTMSYLSGPPGQGVQTEASLCQSTSFIDEPPSTQGQNVQTEASFCQPTSFVL